MELNLHKPINLEEIPEPSQDPINNLNQINFDKPKFDIKKNTHGPHE